MIPWRTISSLPLLVCLLWCHSVRGQLPSDEVGTALVRSAIGPIEAYHRDAEKAGNVIRVVYFHPRDRQPLDQWRERLGRMLNDIGDFYRTGLQRYGVKDRGIPFERNNDGYVFHLVQGRLSAGDYTYESGGVIERELWKELAGTIRFDRQHVLVVHGLCHQEKDGRYIFNAPYYGRGSQQNGLCHAADCQLLDPKLLTAKDRKIVYAEHYYPRKEQTVALFNTWYLGGLAHELGHGIGLPHDAGRPPKRSDRGFALMGSGNHHYREERWGGNRPAYLSLGSTLRLLSHPLVTDSDRGRFTKPDPQLDALTFSGDKRLLKLAGQVRSDVPAYAVIGYLWRPPTWPGNSKYDHHSVSHPALVCEDTFELKIHDFDPGDYRLRLSVLHCNGAATDFDFHLKVDRDGGPNLAELNAGHLVSQAESAVIVNASNAAQLVSQAAIDGAPTAEAKAKLQVLSELLAPPAPIDLATTPRETVYLSDAKWLSAKVGWRDVARNHYDRDKQHRNSIFLELQGQFYAKGLYAHSKSSYVFDLRQRWKKFTATIGLRDGASQNGSAIFTVRGDGKQLYQSPILRQGQSKDVELNVSRVNELELATDGGEGHIHNSWAIWVEPKLER